MNRTAHLRRPFVARAIFISCAVILAALAWGCYMTRGYLVAFMPGQGEEASKKLNDIRLPPGFSIEVYTGKVPGARSLTRSGSGILFVGTRQEGKVYAVVDDDEDYRADRVFTIASGLNQPNGVAVRDGDLYVAEIGRILKFPDIEASLESPGRPIVVTDQYPKDEHHGWKFIAFGPDGKLYVPVGAPCNVCEPEKEIYASITRLNPDGTDLEVIARGVRNSVGFDWHPRTGELWFTDNGRDWMGDDRPPDELNRLANVGMHFGFPHCHGGGLPDPEHHEGKDCGEFTAPEMELGPHVAALGMRFYEGEQFPEKYRSGIFISEHGSWNRTVPIGYRVMFVKMEDGRPQSYEVFAEGWLRDTTAWGRPVDILVLPDGSLLVSDDRSGTVYRVRYDQ